MGSHSSLPKKANGKFCIFLYTKDFNKTVIWGNSEAPSLEEMMHILSSSTTYRAMDAEKWSGPCSLSPDDI